MKLGSAWSSPKEMAANCHAMTPTRESEAETQQDYDQKDCRCLAHDPKLAGTAMSVNTNKIAFPSGIQRLTNFEQSPCRFGVLKCNVFRRIFSSAAADATL